MSLSGNGCGVSRIDSARRPIMHKRKEWIIINLMEIIWDDMIEFAIITLFYWHLFHHIQRTASSEQHKMEEKYVLRPRCWWEFRIKLKYEWNIVFDKLFRNIDDLIIYFPWWHYIWLLRTVHTAFGNWYRFIVSQAHANWSSSRFSKEDPTIDWKKYFGLIERPRSVCGASMVIKKGRSLYSSRSL